MRRAPSLALWIATLAACKSTTPPAALRDDGPSGGVYTTTKFSAYSFACSQAPGANYPGDSIVGIGENSPLLPDSLKFQCIDHFKPLDFGNPPWQAGHWFMTMSQDTIISYLQQVPSSFQYMNGQWTYNEPDCTTPMAEKNVCGLAVAVKGNDSRPTSTAPSVPVVNPQMLTGYIFDGCPEHHWNNAIKDLPDHPEYKYGGNPCRSGAYHVDLKDVLWGSLGFPSEIFQATVVANLGD